MQFFSIGVAGSLIGYALFFNCATINDYQTENDYLRCKNEGPGSKINLITDIVGFLLQIVLCWISFLMIPYSKTKGEFKYKTNPPGSSSQKKESLYQQNNISDEQNKFNNIKNNQDSSKQQNQFPNNQNISENYQGQFDNENEHRSYESDMFCLHFTAEKYYFNPLINILNKLFLFQIHRGGRLKCFMIYDIIIFAICLGVMLVLIFVGHEAQDDWQKYQLIYMIKTAYGILNFPWLVFIFPPMMTILTTAKETGYDRYGVTQKKHVNYKELKKQRKEERKKKKQNENNQNQKEKEQARESSMIDIEQVGLLNAELNVEELIQQQNQ